MLPNKDKKRVRKSKISMLLALCAICLTASMLLTSCGLLLLDTDEASEETTKEAEQTTNKPEETTEEKEETTEEKEETTEEKEETTKEPETTAPQDKVEYTITNSSVTTWLNSIGTTWMQVIVEIENTGDCNLYLSAGSVDIEKANGELVDTMSTVSVFPQIIAPGEKAYMYEETTLDNPVDGELKANAKVEAEKAKVRAINYKTSDVKLKSEQFLGVEVIGRVENNTEKVSTMMYIVSFFYDKNGKMIGLGFNIRMDDLNPGDKTGFKITGFSLPDSVTVDSIDKVVVTAYEHQIQF